jgi:hypothetical protein
MSKVSDARRAVSFALKELRRRAAPITAEAEMAFIVICFIGGIEHTDTVKQEVAKEAIREVQRTNSYVRHGVRLTCLKTEDGVQATVEKVYTVS